MLPLFRRIIPNCSRYAPTPLFKNKSANIVLNESWKNNSRFNTFYNQKSLYEWKKLRLFVQSKSYSEGYRYYRGLLESKAVKQISAEDFVYMIKIASNRPETVSVADEIKFLLKAMEERGIKPTKEHIKTIVEGTKFDVPLDFAYEAYVELTTKHNIKIDSTVFSAYVEACLFKNDVDRALRFISSSKDQDVVILRDLYVEIILSCLRNLMPTKAIEICRIVSADGPFFKQWDVAVMLTTAMEHEEIRAVVYFLDLINTLDEVKTLDEGTIFAILVLASKNRNIELAKKMMSMMREQNIEISPAIHFIMARTYFNNRNPKEGFEYLQTMIDMGIELSPGMKNTISSLCCVNEDYLNACLEVVTAMHQKRGNVSVELLNIILYACAELKLYGSALLENMKNFGVTPTRDSFHAVIKGLAYEPSKQHMLSIFTTIESMKNFGLNPDEQTYYYLLDACTRSGQLEASEDVLERMRDEGLRPTAEHFICLGSAFARRGEIEAAKKVVQTVKQMKGDYKRLQDLVNRMATYFSNKQRK